MSDRSQNRFLYAEWLQKDDKTVEVLINKDAIEMIHLGDQRNTCFVLLKDERIMTIKANFDDLSELLLGALD